MNEDYDHYTLEKNKLQDNEDGVASDLSDQDMPEEDEPGQEEFEKTQKKGAGGGLGKRLCKIKETEKNLRIAKFTFENQQEIDNHIQGYLVPEN